MAIFAGQVRHTDIIKYFKEKEVDKKWAFAGLKPLDTGKWTHSYHRYPAKFIPQLAEALIKEYIKSDNAHINDPFMGSGTTVVTSISKGLKASGTDINQIAYLMTKVKSTPIEPEYLDKKIDRILSEISFEDNKRGPVNKNHIQPLIPQKHIKRIDHWFDEKNRIELGKILRIIQKEKDKSIKDFFLAGFSHILKNCSIWSQGSTKPTRDLKKNPASPCRAFRIHLKKMQRGNQQFYSVVPEKIKENLSQYLNIKRQSAKEQPVSDESVDLIISSSPYVTSYEYADLHQLSTIWLDFTDDLTAYKKEFIGSAYKKQTHKKLKSSIARDIIDKMLLKNKKMAVEIKTFFIDMQDVFDESYRILKKGGRCCYVIGDTILKGVEISNSQVFAESLQASGFILDRVIKREIPLKILPQKRDSKTGRFAKNSEADSQAYPVEYIVIGLKE